MLFNRITIIGMGLIGSSLARAIKRAGICTNVTGVDRSADVCAAVERLKLVDYVSRDAATAVKDSDLIIIAVPISSYAHVASLIGPHVKEGAIISDVGSVKQSAIDSLLDDIPPHAHIVPAHPIAGTEHSGPEAGLVDLFDERWCILTPLPDTDLQAVGQVTAFWEACGAVIEIMEPAHHDLVLGITSHLPHLIAYTIVGTADELEDDIKSDVIKFSASGFRGFTRIAASDPTMWRDVFLNNREAVLDILQRFTEDLTTMQKAIRRGDGDHLFDAFTQSRVIRREVMELGAAGYPSPERMSVKGEADALKKKF